MSGRVTTLLVRALLVALVLAPAVAVAAGGVPEVAESERLMADLTAVLEESDDAEMLLQALTQLRDMYWEPALSAVRKLSVAHEDPQVRREAVRFLGWYGAKRDWELIILGLYSADQDDVIASIQAVADFGEERGLTYLEDLTLDPRPAVREAAERGLRELTWFLEAIEVLEVIETLADAVETDAAEAIARGKELLVSLREWIWREGPWDHGRTAEALQWVPGLTEADIPRLRGLLMSVKASGLDDAEARTESLGTVIRLVVRRSVEAGGT